mmetsp:Transcript_13299/g.22585  ORF Transcript_13299/g.22585 Transcript_13299/m.22585 type:complete len:153 (+) Transcript_13299:45-503(+)
MRRLALGSSIIVLGLGLSSFKGSSSQVKASEQKEEEGIQKEVVLTKEKQGGVSNRYFRFAASNIPHDSKKDKGGEDAWVAQEDFLVVADGVGGWANQGIDSGLFSKQLVTDIKLFYDKDNAGDLKEILIDAVKANKEIGSSTCVLAKFDTEQ